MSSAQGKGQVTTVGAKRGFTGFISVRIRPPICLVETTHCHTLLFCSVFMLGIGEKFLEGFLPNSQVSFLLLQPLENKDF